MVHTYSGIVLRHKKERNNAICSHLDGSRDYHTKSDRETQMPYDSTYILNLKKWYKWTYLQNRNRLRLRKQTYGYQKGKVVVGGINWDFGIDTHTLLYLK